MINEKKIVYCIWVRNDDRCHVDTGRLTILNAFSVIRKVNSDCYTVAVGIITRGIVDSNAYGEI